MSNPGVGRVFRKVRVRTTRGSVVGLLPISEQVRTLDDINMVATRFVVLQEPEVEDGDLALEPGPLAINKSQILFLSESEPPRARTFNRLAAARKSRSPVRLMMEDFTIEGFVHIPVNGKALIRLRQEGHSFIAITTVKVTGPHATFEAPFLAVNRDHVLAAQELPQVSSDSGVDVERSGAAIVS